MLARCGLGNQHKGVNLSTHLRCLFVSTLCLPACSASCVGNKLATYMLQAIQVAPCAHACRHTQCRQNTGQHVEGLYSYSKQGLYEPSVLCCWQYAVPPNTILEHRFLLARPRLNVYMGCIRKHMLCRFNVDSWPTSQQYFSKELGH